MKKFILNWLFGTDNVKRYIELLVQNRDYNEEIRNKITDHIKTLEREKEDIAIMRKLIKICENHGIDVDKEIKEIEL